MTEIKVGTRRVWRYPLQTMDCQTLSIPALSRILGVGERNGELCLWALVDPQLTLEVRAFRVAVTDAAIAPDLHAETYLGTVQLFSLAWHVWEVQL